MRPIKCLFLLIIILIMPACDGCNENPASPSAVVTAEEVSNSISVDRRITGVELRSIHGWFANIYPWGYDPEHSTVHPVPSLWTPGNKPSPFQMSEQCRQIRDFGAGAVVLEYTTNQSLDWHNYWLSVGFASGCGPFFLLYEHINGTNFNSPIDTPKNMDDPFNRKVFKDDIEFMFKNVILPNQSRYITVDGRAVIFMWASSQMTGDFASLLEEVKNKYPVFFIGSDYLTSSPRGNDLNRIKALDGFMQYGLGLGNSYLNIVNEYWNASQGLRRLLRNLESETGKKYLFIPTFMAAYDDTKVPGRTTMSLYPKNKEEMEYHAELIRSGMGSVYDNLGPFVIYNELPEGSAVIESQCLPSTQDRPGRYVGCGKARLEILKRFFY